MISGTHTGERGLSVKSATIWKMLKIKNHFKNVLHVIKADPGWSFFICSAKTAIRKQKMGPLNVPDVIKKQKVLKLIILLNLIKQATKKPLSGLIT